MERIKRTVRWSGLIFMWLWIITHTGCSVRETVAPEEPVASPNDSLLLNWETIVDSTTVFLDVRSLFAEGNGTIWVGCRDGLFRSGDSGNTWKAEDLAVSFVWDIVEDGAGRVFVGTDRGVYKKTLPAGNWLAAGLQNEMVLSLAVHDSFLIAGTTQGIFVSRDGGESWSDRGMPWLIVPECLAVNESNCLVGSFYQGLFRSADTGQTLVKCDLPVDNVTVYALTHLEPQTVWAGCAEGYLFKSSNGGFTWSALDQYPASTTINSLAVTSGNNAALWVGRADGEIWHLATGANRWQIVYKDSTGASVRSLAVLGSQIIFAGTSKGLLRAHIENF